MHHSSFLADALLIFSCYFGLDFLDLSLPDVKGLANC